MPKKVNRNIFIEAAKQALGSNVNVVTRPQIMEICKKNKLPHPNWLTQYPEHRGTERGTYVLNSNVTSNEEPKTDVANHAEMALSLAYSSSNSNTETNDTLIPEKTVGYVPFGHFSDLRSIIKTKKFYPVFVTGLSGNGKTVMVEQVCANEKRECIRVNITVETDEDDLIGGFRLENGKTVWQNGPVVVAMERGAILLLDEVDLGSNKLMCLQPILEGKSVFLKKINRVVHPAKGFNIIATANTKGKGSDDGRFIGTNVLNEAFLERFSITMEQEYPSAKIEEKILANVLAKNDIESNDFVKKLVAWAEVTRKSFYDGAVSEIISTRRLVHICEAFVIFNQNREKAVQLCLNRFDVDTKQSFMDLYCKLDETVVPASVTSEQTETTNNNSGIGTPAPF